MPRGFNPLLRFKNLGTWTTQWGQKTEQEPFHFGVDIANVKGTPIPAPTDGVVTKVITGIPHGANSYGNSVSIKDPEGNTQQFHHLEDSLVQPGQQVKAGQPVAKIGDSGATYSPSNSDSSNLDLRIVTAYGKYVSPLTYLKKISKGR